MSFVNLKEGAKNLIRDKFGRVILGPLNGLIDDNITNVTTTIGSFIIRSIRNKFERSITFTIGVNYSDKWMEEALYGILYKYNDIKKMGKLELANVSSYRSGAGLYYRLDSGAHNLKYRGYDILLIIQTITPASPSGRISPQRIYQIITYDLDPKFMLDFERDMILHRNSFIKIKADAPTINVYKDLHESDGFTYWEKGPSINKRRINTIYLPLETKKKIVDTLNNFFAANTKEHYKKHGISHNLKILLYGPPGTGKDSIAKMIASEWNRNIFYLTGGKGGRFIPHSIMDEDEVIHYPLFLISDIDKYPFLINDTNVELESDTQKEEKQNNKISFGQMINALDGVMSGEDKIIVMTTNHIEKFSPTFLRSSRVDLLLEIGYMIPDVFRKYVYDFYGRILPKGIKLRSDKLTAGDLQFDILFLKLTADEFIKKHSY